MKTCMRWQPEVLARLVVLLALGGSACVGTIEATGGPDDPGKPGEIIPPGGGGEKGVEGTAGAGGGIILTTPSACEVFSANKAKMAPAPGPAPLRRLTRVEYNNTITELLGDTSNPATLFAPDVVRNGFDNNAAAQTVGEALSDNYMQAAEQLGSVAVLKPSILPACAAAGQAAGEETCVRTFVAAFGKRAYRRPLTADEITGFVGLYTTGRALPVGYQEAVGMVITSMLQSPGFLYRAEYGDKADSPAKGVLRLTSWEMASRLSYLLWASMPDAPLFAAAEADALKTPDEIAAQAKRLLGDARARGVVARFHSQWLDSNKVDGITLDAKAYPNFETVKPFIKEETARFMENAFWKGDGSVASLFTSTASFMNSDLATFLKVPAANIPKATAGFVQVEQDPAQRSGLLTQARFLVGGSKVNGTSPIVRGKTILERMMCADVPPPPMNAAATPPPPVPGETTRERFVRHEQTGCATCHRIMDPVGFALENFDAAGRWRTMEAGKMVDSSGGFVGTDVDGPFMGPVEMSHRVASSGQMRSCMVKNWFRYGQGREETGADSRSLQQLYCAFEAGNHNMRDLLAGITQMDSFLYKPTGN